MVTCINAITEVVFDGQVLQLQTVILRPNDRRTHHANIRAALVLAIIKHIPRRFARHIFTARVHRTTPVSGAHITVNGLANFHIQRFFASTVKRQATCRCRDIDRALIFARHDRDVLTFVGTFDDCRINRGLNAGMRHALSACRANDKVRLRGQSNSRRAPRRGVWRQRGKIVRGDEVFRFIGRQNRARSGARRGLIGRNLIGRCRATGGQRHAKSHCQRQTGN